jgi:microcystin-dependent protein
MADPFIGEIRMFASVFAPKGWEFCNGQLLPINQYTALFSLLGTYYGGDGKTTFALPDLRSRVPVHVGDDGQLPEVQLGQSGGFVPQDGEQGTTYSAGPYLGVNFIIAVEGIYPSRGD